jgi:thiopeptide-type bacteriocin biosynthesis protein
LWPVARAAEARSTARARRALAGEPLARSGLALAGLAHLLDKKGDTAALGNWVRRASLRPTPHGVWAGVGVAEIVRATPDRRPVLSTGGAPRAVATVAWARLAALGRALLEDAAVWPGVRVFRAPSLVAGGDRAVWLRRGEPCVEVAAPLDETLRALLDAIGRAGCSLAEAREVVGEDVVLALVDDGALVHDLEPPIVGPPSLVWARARVARLIADTNAESAVEAADALRTIADAIESGSDLAEAAALVDALIGGEGEALHVVTVLAPRRPLVVAEEPIARAAAIADVVYGLQEALAPPADERHLDAALGARLDGLAELYGVGRFSTGALVRGEYGTVASAGDDAETRPAADPTIVAWLAEALVAAAARGDDELALDADALRALLGDPVPPPTIELILAPAARGTPWLLALHGPAGATWGRFAAAVGDSLRGALGEVATLERAFRGVSVERVDVAWCPSPRLGDVAAHPPIRPRALALLGRVEGAAALALDDLEIALDGNSDPALVDAATGSVVRAAPLHRLRSTLLPSSVARLAAADTLVRQHAPWALHLGPLADLEVLPRILIDNFVVSPRSWRLPLDRRPASLRRLRRALGLPRWVQIGHEDELLAVDLDEPESYRAIARTAGADPRARLVEVWPPPGTELDRDGRRVELVAAAVREPTAAERARFAAIAALDRVPPPVEREPDRRWVTAKIFGTADRHARLLLEAVAPAIAAARDAGELDRWFVLPYVDGPGHREHLRVRLRSEDAGRRALIRLDEALAPARALGDVVSIEIGPYLGEPGRFGADAEEPLTALFEAESDLACALAIDDVKGAAVNVDLAVVAALESLARGAGLTLDARRALTGRLRAAHGLDRRRDDPHAALYRLLQSRLAALIDHLDGDDRFAPHIARVGRALAPLGSARTEALLPTLCHLTAVRLGGLDPAVEPRAIYLWDRALDSLNARTRRR